jgi:hypothetical protein
VPANTWVPPVATVVAAVVVGAVVAIVVATVVGVAVVAVVAWVVGAAVVVATVVVAVVVGAAVVVTFGTGKEQAERIRHEQIKTKNSIFFIVVTSPYARLCPRFSLFIITRDLRITLDRRTSRDLRRPDRNCEIE